MEDKDSKTNRNDSVSYIGKKILEKHDQSIMFQAIFCDRYEEIIELNLLPCSYEKDPKSLNLLLSYTSQQLVLDLIYNIKIGNLVFKN